MTQENHDPTFMPRVLVRPLATPLPLGFLARDPVAATGMSILAGTWAAATLATVTSRQGAASAGLGIILVASSAAMLVPAVAGHAKVLASAVMGLGTAEPTLLVRNGGLLDHALHEQRLTEAEVLQAIRSTGTGALEDVAAVVLETDGTLSVIGTAKLGNGSALRDVSASGPSSQAPWIGGREDGGSP